MSLLERLKPKSPGPGLCENCVHARRMENDRGSVFLMCQLALTDENFPKYPRLPVLTCRGHKAKRSEG